MKKIENKEQRLDFLAFRNHIVSSLAKRLLNSLLLFNTVINIGE